LANLSIMDFNLSKWLKDDLGLKHMSEADMNNLVYHPRHGSLCRRLVKFLTESTLCSKRYPNVFAQEEHEEAKRDFESNKQLIEALLLKLETQMRTTENVSNELKFISEKYKCLTGIEDMLRTTTEALEEMASRPNVSLIEVGRNLENPKYLGNLSLETLYATFPSYHQKSYTSSDKITRRDLANVNDDYQNLTSKAKIMHDSISELLSSIMEAMSKTDCDVELKKTSVTLMKALKLPDCEEVELEFDPEEKQLRDQREQLLKELQEIDQQVNELAQQYDVLKADLNNRYKLELEKDLALLERLQQIKTTIYSTT
jgi:hypothetical protein